MSSPSPPYTLIPTNALPELYGDHRDNRGSVGFSYPEKGEPSSPTRAHASSPSRIGDGIQTIARRSGLRSVAKLAYPLGAAACFGLGMLSRGDGGFVETRMQLDSRGRPIVGFESRQVSEEWECNPFDEPGRLIVDQNVTETHWLPYDSKCSPSRIMSEIHLAAISRIQTGDHSAAPPHLPWLQGATVLLHGDSMERLHLTDFCAFVGGNLTNITPHHPASPPTYRKPVPRVYNADGEETAASKAARSLRRQQEDEWDSEARSASWTFTRPWVCDIPEYDATIINVFAWGLDDMEHAFHTETFFHGPSTWTDRWKHITLPLLTNLAEYFERPQILSPTLVELCSGYWDLRQFTEQDFIARGIERPYPAESDIPFGPIGAERERKWVEMAKDAVRLVAESLPAYGSVRDGPVISWRTLHDPKRNSYTPYPRVAAIDALARKTMHDLRVSSLPTNPSFSDRLPFPMPSSLVSLAQEGEIDYGFDERLRVNNIGQLLRGQQEHFMDFLHPNANPGGWIWAETMLYELKRAHYRVGRSRAPVEDGADVAR